jgi:hypothetical protein
MSEGRRVLQLMVRSEVRGTNPLRLMVRSGGGCRPFHAHIESVWARVFRPSAGGPSLVSLSPLPRRPRRKPTVR